MKGLKLFASAFAALEAFTSKKAEERTPEMLAAAQAEMDARGADLILVPHSEGISSAKELQAHIDGLVSEATEAKVAAKTAQDALTELKGQRVLGSDTVTSDKKNGGDNNAPKQSKDAQEAIAVAHEKTYTERVMKMLDQQD